MSEAAVSAKLDALLSPLGFTRKGAVWNRQAGYVVEVIDVQVSKTGDTATVNVGVLDTDAHMKLWGSGPPSLVEVPACTVGARIGELIDGKDHWWAVDTDGSAGDIVNAVTEHVLPFVKKMRSRQAMVQWLTDAGVVKKKYPPPIINLAILQGLLGEMSKACELLSEVQRKALGAWRTRASEVAERMGCAS